MSQNKVKITWKAIVAVMLVMATIIAMSAFVSAEFMEAFLGEEYAVAAASTTPSGSSCPGCTQTTKYHDCGVCPSGVTWSPGCATHKSTNYDNTCMC